MLYIIYLLHNSIYIRGHEFERRQDEKHEEVGKVVWHKYSTLMYDVLNTFQKGTKYKNKCIFNII